MDMKKKLLVYLNGELEFRNSKEKFIVLLYYFLNSKTENKNFTQWYSHLITFPSCLVNDIFSDYEKEFGVNKKSPDYGFLGFINKSQRERKIDSVKYETYFNLINLIDKEKYENLYNLLHNSMALLGRSIDVPLLNKFYTGSNDISLQEAHKKHDIRTISLDLIKEDNQLYKELSELYQVYRMNLLKKEGYSVIGLDNLNGDKEIECRELDSLNRNLEINQERLNNIYNLITGVSDFNLLLFKTNLNSNAKGLIGEKIFSESIGGSVVGHLGKKTDVILNTSQFSVKTTYGTTWNNHLAYISDKDIIDIYLSDKRMSHFEKKVNNFNELILSFFKGEDSPNTLVLQKVKMDELNNYVLESIQYSIPMESIERMVRENSYIFNNNELVLIHNREQVLKISLKERTNNLQVMLLTNSENMENLVELGIARKEKIVQQDRQRKKSKTI